MLLDQGPFSETAQLACAHVLLVVTVELAEIATLQAGDLAERLGQVRRVRLRKAGDEVMTSPPGRSTMLWTILLISTASA